MKSLVIQCAMLAAVAHPLTGQPSATGPIEMTARKMSRDGSILHGSGGVAVMIGNVALHAETGVWNRQTNEVILSGHVRVALPARTDHNLFRYDSSALVTGKACDVYADRLKVRNMSLAGAGHIKIDTGEAQLTADEIEMDLNTADARVKGNIQATGVGSHQRTRVFPPELIKP